jgi:hypothetical protein
MVSAIRPDAARTIEDGSGTEAVPITIPPPPGGGSDPPAPVPKSGSPPEPVPIPKVSPPPVPGPDGRPELLPPPESTAVWAPGVTTLGGGLSCARKSVHSGCISA